MNSEYWLNRWVENRIGFHKSEVNPLLARFLPDSAKKPCRTLVPLCGKSVDVPWLAARGHDVVGIELSEIAIRDLVSEQGIEVRVVEDPPFTILRSERISLYIGDFFDATAERIGRFDLIYDRAAMIAIPEGRRSLYADRLQSLLEPAGCLLLISIEYDALIMEGPPYCIAESDVRSLFDTRSVRKLYEHDCLDEEPRFRERGLSWMKEVVYQCE